MNDDWRIELIAALAVGFLAVIGLVSCPRGTRAQQPTALIGQCPPPDSAYRVTRVERQDSSFDPTPILHVWFVRDPQQESSGSVFVYGADTVPFVRDLQQETFDIRMVKQK